MLTQERLKELFNYDPLTGIFTRKIASGRYNRFPIGSIVGSPHSQGYLIAVVDGKNLRLHRLAWLYVYGELPKEIDHINNVKDDNRIANLRICNRSENVQNVVLKANNTSGYKGIHKDKYRDSFRAQIKVKNKILTSNFSFSQYGSKDLALQAAIDWVKLTRENLHGEFVNHG